MVGDDDPLARCSFDQVDTGDGYVALRAHANGLYVTAGDSPLIANRTAIGAWEKFYIRN
jgi:hypothetical protein